MMNHDTLIRAAQQGDIGAFRRLLAEYDAEILASALRIAGSEQDASRLYREAMVRVHRDLPGFRFECAFSIWIYRQFAEVSTEFLKRKPPVRGGGMEAALDRLTPRERLVVELKHYRRETLGGIGEILGITAEAAGRALVRGLEKLHGGLDGHNPADA
jgi:RNA polymerase sigma-70 factor (ECF subfamily)